MKRIWKYDLEIHDEQIVYLPRGAQALSVIEQFNRPVLYAFVDPMEKNTEAWMVVMHGTGHEAEDIDDTFAFMGTLNLLGGQFILHVFIKRKEMVA